MTPQERQLVSELFDRLSRLETAPRDRDAERAIADGLARAPNALYPLVQTVLVQDEALKHAEARIRELGGEEAETGGGFLDSMRQAFSGGRTSVPSVRAATGDSRWNTGAALQQSAAPAATAAPAPGIGGGSFLGTAAATAAGVIGGSLLFNSLGGLFGQSNSGSAFGNTRDNEPSGSPSSNSPWDNNTSGGDLSRDAGLNDVGGDRGAGLFDAGPDDGGDFGGDGGGD